MCVCVCIHWVGLNMLQTLQCEVNQLHATVQHSPTESQRDKQITREDEYSDSEDEGDGRRDDQNYLKSKRPRLAVDDQKPSIIPKGVAGGQTVESPVPPEHSPITPLPQEDGTAPAANKGRVTSTCS